MRKWFVACLALIMGAFILTGCGGNSTTDTSGKSQKIVVGLDDQFPPMGFRNEKNEIVGFDIDMATEAFKRLEIEAEFKAIDWSSKEAELKSGRVDLLWNGFTILEERKKNVLFSKPYMGNKQIVVIKTGATPLASKDDLAGKVLAVQEDSSGMNSVNKEAALVASLKDYKKYPDFTSAFMDLENGRIDAVVGDEVLILYYLEKNPGKFKVVDTLDFGLEVFGVGMRLDDVELQGKLDKVLDDMKADGTAAKISDKWFGRNLIQ